MGILLHQTSSQFYRSLGLLLAILLLSSGLGAWSAPPAAPPSASDPFPDLRALRSGLRRSLITASLPELRQYRDELAALEQKEAAAQDYAKAITTRDARVKVEQQISSLEQEANMLAARASVDNAARLAARIELKVSDARLTSTQIDSADGSVSGWGTIGASASWELPSLPPGGYEVLVRYSGSAGEILVKESFYSLTCTCKEDSAKPLEQNLGTLRIKEGKGSLTLTASPPEKCSSWKVYSVVLVPSTI